MAKKRPDLRIDAPQESALRGPNMRVDDIHARIQNQEALEHEAQRFLDRLAALLQQRTELPEVVIGQEALQGQISPPHADTFEDVVTILELAVRAAGDDMRERFESIADEIARRWPVEYRNLSAEHIANLFAKRKYRLRDPRVETNVDVLEAMLRVTVQRLEAINTVDGMQTERLRLLTEIIGPIGSRLAEISREMQDQAQSAVARIEVHNEEYRTQLNALKREASLDDKTKLLRPAYFVAEVDHAMNTKQYSTGILCYVDLNGVKMANDTYGHASVDTLLRHIGSQLLERLGTYNTDTTRVVCGRLGGDEMCIALFGASYEDEETLTAFGEDCQLAFTEARTLVDQQLFSGEAVFSNAKIRTKLTDASFGFVSLAPGQDIEERIDAADKLMKEAKEHKRVMNYPACYQEWDGIASLSGEILPQQEWEDAFAAARQEAAEDQRLQ